MIEFTDAAALKLQEVLEEEGDSTLNLRVLIQGGGCSGFQYGFTLDKDYTEVDTVIENQGVKLLIDPISIQYLDGSKIDYTESFESSHFEIRNPNAVSTCGCGSSFAV